MKTIAQKRAYKKWYNKTHGHQPKDVKEQHGLLKEIGEKIVAYELRKRGWEIFLNTGIGYDLLAIKGRRKARIEVKTTDPAEKVGKYKQHMRGGITNRELITCDAVVWYFHGLNKFLVIPIRKLKTYGKKHNIAQYIKKDVITKKPLERWPN